MTTQQESQELSLILDEVEVLAVDRLSPSFVRVELGGPPLADFGVDGPLYDLRIKLVFPNDVGELPSFAGADESWWDTWLELPEAERGHMRTYTVRAVRGAGLDTRMVVDLVLHPAEGQAGPGSTWAEQADVGDRLLFHEYFDGDTGRGLGASHQTGWTALVIPLLERMAAGAERKRGKRA